MIMQIYLYLCVHIVTKINVLYLYKTEIYWMFYWSGFFTTEYNGIVNSNNSGFIWSQ